MSETQQTRYRVTGMDCAACAAKIETAVRRVAGVADVRVSVTAGTLVVQHAPAVDLAGLEARVASLGYATTRATAATDAAASAADQAGDHDCCGHDHAHAHPHAHAHAGHDHDAHVHDQRDHDGHAHQHDAVAGPWWSSRKARLTIASGIALVAAFVAGRLLPDVGHGAYVAALAIGLAPIALRALAAARAGIPFTIEMLMTIAAVGAVLIGAAEEGAVVVFLFLVGEMLEGIAAGRARASIQGLTDLVPKTALVETDGGIAEVPATAVLPGAVVRVRPGDRVAADGEILSGESSLDESPVSGESVGVRKGPGDAVFAGTVNGEGVLRIRVTAAAADNTIARVVRLVEEAQESKAPTQRFIDRFARSYTPAVVVAAAAVAILPPLVAGADGTEWTYKGLAILLIGCPCALVISTPAAIAASLSAGARRGLLMKGGAVLEAIGRVTAVALDKTGTLTAGKPVVTDVIAGSHDVREVVRIAAGLEGGSSHPLALAILADAASRGVVPAAVANGAALGGTGVVGSLDGVDAFIGSPAGAATRAPLGREIGARIDDLQRDGKSVSVLVVGGAVAGVLAMRDEPRADARAGIAALRKAGLEVVMLTGDNRRVADGVARELGIAARAELLPDDKRRIVGELQAAGHRVAKVGDGINDAPALAAADVGIAVGGGTDVALETADAAILHGRVTDVADMIALSRRTMANVRQNVAIALGLKALFLVSTIAGITGLWPAILADTGATVLVTANAMRLLRAQPPVG